MLHTACASDTVVFVAEMVPVDERMSHSASTDASNLLSDTQNHSGYK